MRYLLEIPQPGQRRSLPGEKEFQNSVRAVLDGVYRVYAGEKPMKPVSYGISLLLLMLVYGIVGGMEAETIPLRWGSISAFLALAGAAVVTYIGNGGDKA